MSYDSYEVPDGIEPIVGYRGWLIKDDALWSAWTDIREVRWPEVGPLEAKCLPPPFQFKKDPEGRAPFSSIRKHSLPIKECSCGIYALHEPPKPRASKPWPAEAVTGIVKGWGHIVMGSKGFRAQYARPIALIARPRSKQLTDAIEHLAFIYGINVIDAKEVKS